MNTQRTIPGLLGIFPDNHLGLITPQSARDLIVSTYMRGPADWVYRVTSSSLTGSMALSGDLLSIDSIDYDGFDHSEALAAIWAPGSMLRAIGTAGQGVFVYQIKSVTQAGTTWRAVLLTLAATPTPFSLNNLVALSVWYPNRLESPGSVYAAENKSGNPVPSGAAVGVDSSGSGFIPCIASSPAVPAIGILQSDTLNTVAGPVQTDGIFYQADWTTITGAAGLTARGVYFLADTFLGRLSLSAPTTPGKILQEVGQAVSSQVLRLQFSTPILL